MFTYIFLFFIVISVCNFGLFSFFLSQHKGFVRGQIESKAKTVTHTHCIKSSNLYKDFDTISWEDNNKEIKLNGILYDVAAININDSIAELLLVIDEEETEIKKKFALIFDEDLSDKNTSPIKIMKQFLDFKYLPSNNLFVLHKVNSDKSLNFNQLFNLQIGSPTLIIIPPKSIFFFS